MYRVAVLMSAYNGEKYIKSQLESIFAQKGDFYLDIYVRDDGSQDKTIYYLREYEKKSLIKLYSGDNIKTARSFIELLLKTDSYDFFSFADQDDVWNEDKIKRGIQFLEGVDCPALYCSNAELVGKNLEPLGRNVYKVDPKTNFETLTCAGGLLGCTMIFNNQLAKEIKKRGIPESMVLHDFYCSVVCAAIGGKIIYDDLVSMKYRQHEKNVVGVSSNFIDTLKSRIKDIFQKQKVSISEQAQEILNKYHNEICCEHAIWLKKIAEYKNSLFNRIFLSCSLKTNYTSFNMSVKIRLSILFGNR